MIPKCFTKKTNSPVIEQFHLPPGRRPRIRIRPEIPLVSKLFTCVFTKAKNLHPSIQGNGEKTKKNLNLTFGSPQFFGALYIYIYIHIKDVFFFLFLNAFFRFNLLAFWGGFFSSNGISRQGGNPSQPRCSIIQTTRSSWLSTQ